MPILNGAVEGNDIVIRVYDASDSLESETNVTFTSGGEFGDLFNVVSDIEIAAAESIGDACDINGDGTNNVLDIVGLVQIVLNGEPAIQLSTWEYIDINSNSNYSNQLIGPDQFLGNVTLFYFGKAG